MLNDIDRFPADYTADSKRIILTPGASAKQHLLYAQEIGHLQRRNGNHSRQRSDLNSYLFVLLCSGTGALDYEGARYPLKPGDCFWIDCRHEHSYRSGDESPWKIKWVHFSGLNAPFYYRLFSEQGRPVFPAKTDYPEIDRLLSRLFDAAYLPDALCEIDLSRDITSLLTLGIHIVSRGDTPASGKIAEIRGYLDAHFSEEIRLEDLSRRFFISRYHLSRSFKERYDLTISDYVIQLRVTAAKQLLRYSEKSIAQIAEACGYGNQSYFARQFMKVEGCTPREYQKAWK